MANPSSKKENIFMEELKNQEKSLSPYISSVSPEASRNSEKSLITTIEDILLKVGGYIFKGFFGYFMILTPFIFIIGGIGLCYLDIELLIMGLILSTIGLGWLVSLLYKMSSEMKKWQILLWFVYVAIVSLILHLIFGFENILVFIFNIGLIF
jgi:hypothetical protein